MNSVVAIAVTVACAWYVWQSWSNRRRLASYLDTLDKLIPQFLPRQPEADMAAGDFGRIMPPANYEEVMSKAEEHRLRENAHLLAMEVLKVHSYAMTYEAAWAKAEDILVAAMKVNDAQLTPKLASLMPQVRAEVVKPQGESQPTLQ